MKIDEIIRNPYYLVAGILLLLISLILVGFALVIGDIGRYPRDVFDRNVAGYPFQAGTENPELKQLEDDLTEFVAEYGCETFDTEKGTIEIVDYYVDDVLPLCLTQDVLDNYWLTVKVKGKYVPEDGTITLIQKGEYMGTIDIDWIYRGHEECYYDYWTAKFTLTDGPIELASNQWPDGAKPLEDCVTIPGKEVIASWCTLWKGCEDRNQKFRLIQTQIKDRPLDDPNSHEIIISSPV